MFVLPLGCEATSEAEKEQFLHSNPWANLSLIAIASVFSVGAFLGNILISQGVLIWLLPENPVSHAAHGFGLLWGLFVGGIARGRAARSRPESS